LGVYPRDKYESAGGPRAVTIVKHLRAISTSPSLAETNVQHFLDGMVFNYLIGAPDAHAKNYSVLIAPDVVVFGCSRPCTTSPPRCRTTRPVSTGSSAPR